MFDGAILGFRFGSAKLNVFGGRNSARTGTNGVEIQPMFAGREGLFFQPYGLTSTDLRIDQSLGAHLQLPLGDKGQINLAYLFLDSNDVVNNGSSVAEPFNRVAVYGGDISYKLGSIKLMGGYGKSDLMYNTDSVYDEDNSAWWVNAKYGGKNDKWGIGAGYKSIDPLYAAPGAWGRIGTLWNPTDIEGFHVGGWLKLSDNLEISAKGEFYRGRDTDNSVLTHDDKVTRFNVGLNYMLSSSSSIDLGFENAEWDFDGDAKPRQTWYTLGFNFGLGSNTNLRLFWQVSDTKADGASPFTFNNQERARGGLIGTQLSVKF